MVPRGDEQEGMESREVSGTHHERRNKDVREAWELVVEGSQPAQKASKIELGLGTLNLRCPWPEPVAK